MRSEDIIQAYDSLVPDRAAKDAMLQNILAAADAPSPARKRRTWVVPAIGAAAVLCVLALPRAPAPPAEDPPQRPLVQSARPPMLSAPAPQPELLTWNGVRYTLRPAPADTAPGELLAQLETGRLYGLADAGEDLLLLRGDAAFLCTPVP